MTWWTQLTGTCEDCGVSVPFGQEKCSIDANDSDYGDDRLKEDFVDNDNTEEMDDWLDANA